MPRKRAISRTGLLDRALARFWAHGYAATSVDDLVKATGVSRHGIYSDHGGKKALFLACFDRYADTVVTPAFAQVEATGAGIVAIAAYFEAQIARAEATGLPGPGCFVANSATEVAPHDPAARAFVTAHNDRLRAGFAKALSHDGLTDPALAGATLVFATGLWSLSRVMPDAAPLRASVAAYLSALTGERP